MTGMWERIYQALDTFNGTVIGGEFLPSAPRFGHEDYPNMDYPTCIRVHLLFDSGTIGIVDAASFGADLI